jgi:hypothetical protein
MAILLPNSIEQRHWIPEGGLDVAKGGGDAAVYKLNTAAKPLEAVRPYMTLVDGINIPGTGGDLHGAGVIGFMSGEATGGDRDLARGPSVDQLIARQSPLVAGTPFPSLPLACDHRADEGGLGPRFRCMSYDAKGGAVVGENHPYRTYQRLFGSMASPGSTEADRQAALERARAANASVLDYVRGSLEGLRRRVPGDERTRLDQHLEGIRELERSLAAAPARPMASATLDPAALEKLVANDSKSYRKILDAYLETVKLSFQLDLTRVSSLMLAGVQSNIDFSLVEPGFGPGRVHFMSHEGTKHRDHLLKVSIWYANRLATYINELAAAVESDATKMIANTMILLFTECTISGSNPHHHSNVPVALFGGSALGLKGNRCLRYGGRTSNDLMVTIARAFGVPINTFGKASFNSKPLSALF